MNMNDDSVVSMAQLKELIKLGNSATFIRNNREEAYIWINTILGKFRYRGRKKREKSIIRTYLRTMTGYSNTQINRLIQRKRATGRVRAEKRTQPVFPRVYTADDIALLGAVDNAEQRRHTSVLPLYHWIASTADPIGTVRW